MSTLELETKRLNNIKKMYDKTTGDMKKMWKKKWFQLTKNISRRYDSMLPADHEDRLE